MPRVSIRRRRRLTLAGGQHAAHDDFFNVGGFDAGAFDRGSDRRGAEIGTKHIGEVALETAHRRARTADDDDGIVVAHGVEALITWFR